MTSSSPARRRRHPSRAAAPTTPSSGQTGAGPTPVRPAARRESTPVRARCCRTWSSEHRLLGGTVVRTRWHQPVCPHWAER
ncbi:hypothetical protein OHV05_01965 [Kitasatospora sp. NBC_00070]|uniref:hypothetical protein n=1 Tax=Kitasatospora sp. NBC_00070 TaxID=2975962 RepID=UPI00324768FB